MKIIPVDNERQLITEKELEGSDGTYLHFTDGSSVDLVQNVVVNKGTGSLYFKHLPLWPSQDELSQKHYPAGTIKNISISGGYNNIIIKKSDELGQDIICFGYDDFINETDVQYSSETLYVSTPKNKKNVIVGETWINGRRQPQPVDTDFGYLIICADYLKNLQIECQGQGTMIVEPDVDSLFVNIKSASSIDCIQVREAQIKISGSGKIHIAKATHSATINISGSGSVVIQDGNLDYADLSLTGSGDILNAATTKKARIKASGSGSIVAAHISEESIEQVSGSGTVTVLQRGA